MEDSPQLDFSAAEVTGSAPVRSEAVGLAASLGGITLLFVLTAVTAILLLRRRTGRPHRWPLLATFPPGAQALVAVALVGLMAVQGVAAGAVWVQTRVVHDSAEAYFQYLTLARLLGLSHAHLFGYTLLYGAIGLFATFTKASETLKCTIISLLLWSGLFDVASWWGIKYITPRLEWLSMTTAVTTASASMLTAVLVIRSIASRGEQ